MTTFTYSGSASSTAGTSTFTAIQPERELETLACFVHGALAALHLLGALYNARQRNHVDAIVHAAVCAYDVHAALQHYDRSKGNA